MSKEKGTLKNVVLFFVIVSHETFCIVSSQLLMLNINFSFSVKRRQKRICESVQGFIYVARFFL